MSNHPSPDQLRMINHIRKLKKAKDEADKTGRPLRLKVGRFDATYENGKFSFD